MSDTQTEKRTKQGGGRAFHSRLEPFVKLISEQRQKRRKCKEIAELLRTEHGGPITFQGVHQFYRRYVKRQARSHWERQAAVHPLPPFAEPSRSPVFASTPPARPFKAPNPDSIKLNDATSL